jgi:hypothetical protein
VDLSASSASKKQQQHDTRTASVKLPPQESTKHVDDLPLSSVADEPLHNHIHRLSLAKQNNFHWRSEETFSISYGYELAMLCDAVTGFETNQQPAYDESCRLEGTWMNSSHVEGILEKGVIYIHHLPEQEKTLEQEGKVLRAKPTFWTGRSS